MSDPIVDMIVKKLYGDDEADMRDEWKPIETAPKDGTWMFCRWPMMRIGMYPLVVFWDDGWWPAHDYARDYGEVYPTHWMLLPVSPAKEGSRPT